MKTWVISDTHFNHYNIIKYCNRPFKDEREMNNKIIANWNKVVAKEDTVFFLGDFAFGKDDYFSVEYWSSFLNGRIIPIKGSHDYSSQSNWMISSIILDYKGIQFFLVHDPLDVPKSWEGYVIAGHNHNHDLVEHPFYNPRKKRFNVSVELTEYKPVDMDKIVEEISFKNEKSNK
jgi:calcineurin-like phosphoesterase family protein